MLNKIEYYEFPLEKNVYVVGDLHGCYSLLMKELKKLNFDFENDILLGVGDLVDRGPESKECLELIDEPWFISVRGNHEDFCIKGADDYYIEIHHKAGNNGGDWFYKLNQDERIKLAEKMNTLPYMIEIEYAGKTFGLVHADLPIQDWDVLKLMLEKDDEFLDRPIKDHLTWGRNLVHDDYANIANIDYVFLGHTVLNAPKAVGNAIFIDTGAVFGNGRELTIMNLRSFL